MQPGVSSFPPGSRPVSPSPDRPIGVALIAVVDMLVALVMLIVSALMAKGIGFEKASQAVLNGLAARAPFLALLALLVGALGLGLWYMQNWARMITIAFSVLSFFNGAYRLVIAGVLAAFVVRPGLGPMAVLFYYVVLRLVLSAVIAIYLLRPGVARAFSEAW